MIKIYTNAFGSFSHADRPRKAMAYWYWASALLPSPKLIRIFPSRSSLLIKQEFNWRICIRRPIKFLPSEIPRLHTIKWTIITESTAVKVGRYLCKSGDQAYQEVDFSIPLYSKPSRKWQQRFPPASSMAIQSDFVASVGSSIGFWPRQQVWIASHQKSSFSVKVVFPAIWVSNDGQKFFFVSLVSSFRLFPWGMVFKRAKVREKSAPGFMNDDLQELWIKNHFS